MDFKKLSSDRNAEFTPELIRAHLNEWNWEELSANEAISWDYDMIGEFFQFINFKSLSSNPNLAWFNSGKNIFDKIDAEKFSVNASFHPDLFYSGDTFRSSYAMEFKPKIVWCNPLDKDAHDVNWNTFKKIHVKECVSSNPFIDWNEELLLRFGNYLDFWTLAVRSKLSVDLVLRFAAKFDEVRYTHKSFRRHSDWGTFPVANFQNGWQNLAMNINFEADKIFFDFAQENYTYVVPKIDDFDYNFPNFDFEGAIKEYGEIMRISDIFDKKYSENFSYNPIYLGNENPT